MSTWTFGDLHGNFKALQQIFERAPIKKGDTIISLGDICDGWPHVRECVDLLISMQKDYNMIFCIGNHDDWMKTWLETSVHPDDWAQGGIGVIKSYATAGTRWEKKTPPSGWSREAAKLDYGWNTNLNYSDIPEEHVNFFKKQHLFYIDEENNLFVHGGFNRHFPFRDTPQHIYYWDRDLFLCALSAESGGTKLRFKDKFKNIFIGHTAVLRWKTTLPVFADIVINLDTGAGGKKGKLTIMNVDTKEYFQSDTGEELYPDEEGRTNI